MLPVPTRLTSLPFPAWPYRPGVVHPDGGRTADKPPLESAKALLPARYTAFVRVDDIGFGYGIDLHNHGYFWEAHEIWEAVWIKAQQNGLDRIALRVLIQITNAELKSALGKPRASHRLLNEAILLLDELTNRTTGLALNGSKPQESITSALDILALRRLCEERFKSSLHAPQKPLFIVLGTAHKKHEK